MKTAIFWFRRDLRIDDNTALNISLNNEEKVLPIFIFDDDIIDELSNDDHRLTFIYEQIRKINSDLIKFESGILVKRGKTIEIFKSLLSEYCISNVYANKDYEPYAINRDSAIKQLLNENQADLILCKDQVIFEENEILKDDGLPYTVFTPFKRKWLKSLTPEKLICSPKFKTEALVKGVSSLPELEDLGLDRSQLKMPFYDVSKIKLYHKYRDSPGMDATTYLGTYLRFGVISIRKLVKTAIDDEVFLSELIWREFFMQILFHFPNSIHLNFKRKYDGIKWRNNEDEFRLWCEGKTGYPLVDAGMRQLNETGFMHNRVRMLTASFLIKHLLIDWKWGEAYFAKKLFDFELSSNVGNWQWAAGTGCDAAPYFRIFNPITQHAKFDPNSIYVNRWLPEYQSLEYTKPIVEHSFARLRALETYKNGILK